MDDRRSKNAASTSQLPTVAMPQRVVNPAIGRVQSQTRRDQALKHTGMEPNEMRRVESLQAAADAAYGATRVYHATHHHAEPGIQQTGLVPQGGPSMSATIGDSTRSKGHVFFTKDKTRAGYFAATSAGLEGARRKLVANRMLRTARREDYGEALDAFEDEMSNPPRPTIMRAILSPATQRTALPDEKADPSHDYMLPREIAPGHMLPGHERPDFQPSPGSSAVSVFQRSMQQVMPGVSRTEATAMLQRKRSDSITKDADAIEHGKPEAKEHVAQYNFMHSL